MSCCAAAGACLLVESTDAQLQMRQQVAHGKVLQYTRDAFQVSWAERRPQPLCTHMVSSSAWQDMQAGQHHSNLQVQAMHVSQMMLAPRPCHPCISMTVLAAIDMIPLYNMATP